MASMRRDAALGQIDRLFGEGTLAGLSDARLLEQYVAARDESAFEALVRRHGPMVLSVCRRVLIDPNDADDAFQAAFLLLARKARSIWVEGSIGGWLHRVAWRIAVQLRNDASRRREQERRAVECTGKPLDREDGYDDTAAVIHQEIDRLPERYRRPVVLCFLEDMTYQQAADHLHWTEATTRGRLSRARALLRDRLARRGLTLAATGLAVGIGDSVAASTVPAGLLRATVRAARNVALGDAAAAGVSSTAIALARRAARTMLIARLKGMAAAVVALATLTGLATGLIAAGLGGDGPKQATAKARQAPGTGKKADAADGVVLRGRVLGPDGKPAAGASLYTVSPEGERWGAPILRTKAGPDGSFRIVLPRADVAEPGTSRPWMMLTVLATADGFGPDWLELSRPPDGELTLRLVADDVPIAGRILDLQGRPVVGARVTLGRIVDEGTRGIDPYLKLVREDPFRASNHHFAKYYWTASSLPGGVRSVFTDAEGRFRLTGIGRERIVDLSVEGPAIQSAALTVMTRNAPAVSSAKGAFGSPMTVLGATFDHLIPPGRALTGVVRDRRTRQPLAGLAVGGKDTNSRVTTDGEGHFTLGGFPKGPSYGLMVLAGERPPYFVTCLSAPDTAGLDPIRVDVDCQPGIPLRLKLIDRDTGKAPKGVEVSYWPLYPNRHTRDVPGYAPVGGGGAYNEAKRQDDGTYLLGVLPGPGAVTVRAREKSLYRPASVNPRAFFLGLDNKDKDGQAAYGDGMNLIIASGGGYAGLTQLQFCAIVLVNPAEDSGPINAEAVLERDRKREVRVLDPDGKLLEGATVEGEGEVVEATATPGIMTISGLVPARPKRLHFRHSGRKLAGLLVARGDEPEPYTVRLQPWAAITGRLVDAQGRPRVGAQLMIGEQDVPRDDRVVRDIYSTVDTDGQGQFRIEGLVPGRPYSALVPARAKVVRALGIVFDRIELKPGEVRDLGDVRVAVPRMMPGP